MSSNPFRVNRRRIISLLFFYIVSLDAFITGFGGVGHADTGAAGLSLMQAVSMTLVEQTDIHIQQEQVKLQRGVLQEARGAFNPTLRTSLEKSDVQTPFTDEQKLAYGNLIDKETVDVTTYSLGLNKLFRTGISVEQQVQLKRVASNLDRFNVMNTGADNYSTVSFTLRIPLLKGRGRDATGAVEMAAETDLTATRLDLAHAVSQSVFLTVRAYWDYLGALRRKEILQDSVTRIRQTIADIEEMVKAKERPAADLIPLKAEMAVREATLLEAGQTVLESRKTLGLAIGLAPERIFALPPPSSRLPEPLRSLGKAIIQKKKEYLKLAEKHRMDLQASKRRKRSAEIGFIAARKNLKPELNVELQVGYSGLQESSGFKQYWESINHNVEGLNYTASVNFTYPFGNDAAEGLLVQKAASRRQSVLQISRLDREIRSNVEVALEAVEQSAASLRKARRAVELLEEALHNEVLKYRLGEATILDVINIESELNDKRLGEIGIHVAYAKAVARLRFETGTLLALNEETYRVQLEQLTEIPGS